MTKKLEELFNLDSAEPKEEAPPVATHEEINSLEDQYNAVQEITRTLPQIQELNDLDEKALDDLAKKAEQERFNGANWVLIGYYSNSLSCKSIRSLFVTF